MDFQIYVNYDESCVVPAMAAFCTGWYLHLNYH